MERGLSWSLRGILILSGNVCFVSYSLMKVTHCSPSATWMDFKLNRPLKRYKNYVPTDDTWAALPSPTSIFTGILIATYSAGWMPPGCGSYEAAACCGMEECCWTRCHLAWLGPAWNCVSWHRMNTCGCYTHSHPTTSGTGSALVTNCPSLTSEEGQ